MFSLTTRGKKFFASVRIALIFLMLFSFPASKALAAERLACASYPVWLFARYLNMGRDIFQVELLTNPATGCPHEFAPSYIDLERLTKTRILIKNGLDLESYLDRALKVAPPDITVIDASAGIPTLLAGWGRVDFDGTMTQQSAGTSPAMRPNPHIFLSPKISRIMMANIAAALSKLDPSGADHYAARLADWELETQSLIEDIDRFKDTHRGFKLVTSHGFFDYLAQDLGLAVVADISPLGTEAAPSAQRLASLGRLIRTEKISAILLDPEANPAAGRTLSQEYKIPAAIIDTATSGSYDPPMDFYAQIIREDLDLLNKLLPANVQPPPPAPTPRPAPPTPHPIDPILGD
ncbi:MAG: metal ABC transporter substrate-binding protein [Deltaproteobacteria bacterium]|jgi:zinc/manganese transport system substrate-binding protein/zinc transport system substrate-binding protein|nr:metal ABC transporter substrate-binding protein [Deltaproteobacteria bacterium]